MKAFVLSRYGSLSGVRMDDVPCPVPGPGDVLVRVKAAGLNPVDFKTRDGLIRVVQPYALPTVMGNELAGIVEQVAPDVKGFVPGDRVFARMPKHRMGAFAEFAVVPANLLAHIPATIDFVTAAGVPLAGLTALQALRDELQLGPGSRVFMPGGAGGVGTLAIQIAKWLGAEVITTASPRGYDLVLKLGADRIIDYTTQDFTEHVSDVDGVFDLLGGDALHKAFRIVKPGATVVSVAALPEPKTALKDLRRGLGLAALFWLVSLPLWIRARWHGAKYRFLFMHPSGSELAELAALIENGALVPVIDRTFAFDDIADAFAYLEAGRAKGKVIVEMNT